MSPEMIAILAVGAGLAGLIWQSQRALRAGLGARIDKSEHELGARMDKLEQSLSDIRDRLARLEGMFDIVERYIFRHNEPSPSVAAE